MSITFRGLQSPSDSYGRSIPNHVEKRPPSAARQRGDDAVSEAVWRKFISGSRYGSASQFDGGTSPRQETSLGSMHRNM